MNLFCISDFLMKQESSGDAECLSFGTDSIDEIVIVLNGAGWLEGTESSRVWKDVRQSDQKEKVRTC